MATPLYSALATRGEAATDASPPRTADSTCSCRSEERRWGHGAGTNPEQLFALATRPASTRFEAGCRRPQGGRERVRVSVTVDLLNDDGFSIGVPSRPSSRRRAGTGRELVEQATRCALLEGTRGNIPVQLSVVGT